MGEMADYLLDHEDIPDDTPLPNRSRPLKIRCQCTLEVMTDADDWMRCQNLATQEDGFCDECRNNHMYPGHPR